MNSERSEMNQNCFKVTTSLSGRLQDCKKDTALRVWELLTGLESRIGTFNVKD